MAPSWPARVAISSAARAVCSASGYWPAFDCASNWALYVCKSWAWHRPGEPQPIRPRVDADEGDADAAARAAPVPGAQKEGLDAQDARIAVAEADVRLARADKRPDWKVGVTYGRRDPMYGDMASVGVSIDLPLFAGKRQNPRIAASESLAQGGRFDREAIVYPVELVDGARVGWVELAEQADDE